MESRLYESWLQWSCNSPGARVFARQPRSVAAVPPWPSGRRRRLRLRRPLLEPPRRPAEPSKPEVTEHLHFVVHSIVYEGVHKENRHVRCDEMRIKVDATNVMKCL